MSILKQYPSKSTPGHYHKVMVGDDGIIYCTCWGWKKTRWCKHLEDWTHGNKVELEPVPEIIERYKL